MIFNSIREWAADHKKQILIGVGVGSAIAACAIIGFKNRKVIVQACRKIGRGFEDVFRKAGNTQTIKKTVASAVTSATPLATAAADNVPVIPEEILHNLSGEMMTATQLGNEILSSPQNINARIVAKGLAVKCPGGGYNLTESGKLVGKDIWKTNRYGYSFSNIEWDKRVLEIIFTPEELAAFAQRKQRIDEMLQGIA